MEDSDLQNLRRLLSMSNPQVHPIDWKTLQKGSSISKNEILDFWNYHFPDMPWNEYSMMEVKDRIQRLRASIGKPLVIKQVKDTFRILTDKEAPAYLASQATAGIRKHRRHTRRLFTDIDVDNLDEAQRRDLETKQIHHSFIAANADGARKHSLQLQRKGKGLPKALLNKVKLIPPDA